MKKIVLVSLVVLLSIGQLFANPVDVNAAKSIGEKFVRNNMQSLRGFQSSKHVLTLKDDNGNACLYVFNIEDKGYYIVSADDRAKPILAYSDEGCIDVNNILPAMAYYLEHYKNAISYAIVNDLPAENAIVNEWYSVKTRGVVAERNIGKSVEPLVDLLWNQVYPYNYFCPTEKGGPGGRAYVGCAADVMAMIMKYWNYPAKGKGSHSYIPEGYSIQTVDFADATYDWDNMPKEIFSSSPKKEIEAIAELMYHCGVAIDMQYGPTASSGYSEMVPNAMKKYFYYTANMRHLYRDQHELGVWEQLLRDNLDQGFPIFYAGSSQMSGGHAFLCDGYTEDGYFHFNWGWSGALNGNFAIDALNPTGADYNSNQRVILDVIPDYAHNCMPKSPVIETEAKSAYSKKGVVKVYAPELSELEVALETIDKIVVLRDNKEVFSKENVTPGAVVVFEDEVEEYGIYDYSAYAVSNGVIGRWGNAPLLYGSTCSWNITASTTNYQGWNGASVKLLSGGEVFEEITVANSTPVNMSVIPSLPSIIRIQTFARSTAISARRTLNFSILSSTFDLRRIPAVSMKLYLPKSFSTRVSTASRVVPAISETIILSSPHDSGSRTAKNRGALHLLPRGRSSLKRHSSSSTTGQWSLPNTSVRMAAPVTRGSRRSDTTK